MDISYLFISHDLTVVRYIAHDLAVMYLGKVVESGPAAQIFASPRHPYTEALLKASPRPDPAHNTDHVYLVGEQPSALDRAPGCPLYRRCPISEDVCPTPPTNWSTSAPGTASPAGSGLEAPGSNRHRRHLHRRGGVRPGSRTVRHRLGPEPERRPGRRGDGRPGSRGRRPVRGRVLRARLHSGTQRVPPATRRTGHALGHQGRQRRLPHSTRQPPGHVQHPLPQTRPPHPPPGHHPHRGDASTATATNLPPSTSKTCAERPSASARRTSARWLSPSCSPTSTPPTNWPQPEPWQNSYPECPSPSPTRSRPSGGSTNGPLRR